MFQSICEQHQDRKSKRHSVFKHIYLTNPTVTPEDVVVAAAQQLTQVTKGTSLQGNEQLYQLKVVSEMSNKIANAKTKTAKQGPVKNNGIQRTTEEEEASSSRADEASIPRVAKAQPPRVEEEPRMIVTCSNEAGCKDKPDNGASVMGHQSM